MADTPRRAVLTGIGTLTSIGQDNASFWESLRTDLGLSPLGAKELMTSAFTALFSQAGFALA